VETKLTATTKILCNGSKIHSLSWCKLFTFDSFHKWGKQLKHYSRCLYWQPRTKKSRVFPKKQGGTTSSKNAFFHSPSLCTMALLKDSRKAKSNLLCFPLHFALPTPVITSRSDSCKAVHGISHEVSAALSQQAPAVARGFKSSGRLSIRTFRMTTELHYNKSLEKAIFSVLIF